MRTPTSQKAKAIINDLIVRQGLSYQDAASRCEQEAEACREAAAAIRGWLEELGKKAAHNAEGEGGRT